MLSLGNFFRANVVPVVSVAAALVTCAFVPPDAAYTNYIDWSTLARLACVLAVVNALRAAGAFQWLAGIMVGRCSTARALVCALVGMCGLASMFVTNDMALLALLPLAAACLEQADRRDLVPATFVLQGIAANLCGMLLPFGNPQNIYLTGCFGIGFGEFVATMAAPFALSCVLVAVGCVAFSDRGLVGIDHAPQAPDAARLALLAALLATCVGCVLGVVTQWCALAVVFGALLATDRRGLLATDWGLIVTFAAFFVFSGNLARIDAVASFFARWLEGGALVPAALLSQIISNVPAAVVLSRFATTWPGLLVGVNVGGAGTPVASLATLIVVTQFMPMARREGLASRRFWVLLVGLNAAALVVLLAAGLLLGW